MILFRGTTPAAVAVYAYVYALLKRCPTNPYRMGLTALSSNDAWAPYVVARKPQAVGSGAFLHSGFGDVNR